jgi:hypothetical protein
MRFVEFKLPEKDSPLFTQIFSELSELVELTKDLPEENAVRQQVDAYIEKLKQNANISEDAVEDAEDALLIAIAKQFGGPQATMALMDIKKFKKLVQNEVAQVGTLHQEKGKEQIKSASTEKLAKAKQLAKKIGKDDKWGVTLHNALSYYENDELHTDFLDACLANQGLIKTINDPSQPFRKLNLKDIINPKLSNLFTNQEAFNGLAKLPLSDGTGQGSGIGPGEAIFACLTPNAKKAGKSDLIIDGSTWEVKGGKSQESTGWLDATGAKATDLRQAFLKIVQPVLLSTPGKGRKVFKFKDGTATTLKDIVDNADFRPEKFRELKTVFKLLSPGDQIKTIDALYAVIAPTVKADSNKLYNKYVKDTVNLIVNVTNQSELVPINKLQAKLSMIEYAIGSYKASNFLIYNYVTQDMVVIQGIEGIGQSIDSSESNLITTAITMRGKGADKGSPGVSIKTRDVRSRTKAFN